MNSNVLVSVLLLSCVWQCCCGMGSQVRAAQPTNDNTYQVQRKPPGPAPGDTGISVCLAQIQPPPVNVRFQSLKASKGSEYTRQLVTAAGLACFENSPNKTLTAATDIGACAHAAAGEGLNSFRFDGGVCTGFLAWRPQVRADCQDGGTTLIYVAVEPLTPFAGTPPSNVSGSVRYDNTTSATLVISHDPSTCGVTDNKGFKLGWNGTQVSMVPEGVLEYSLDRRLLCFISTNISLWSIGSDGAVNSDEVIVPVDRTSIFWFGLPIGGCLYHNTDSNELDYDNSDRFCQSLGASLFVEETVGDFIAFADAWKEYLDRHPATYDDDFYVGIKYDTAQSKWVWKSGIEQTNVTTVWATEASEPVNSAVQTCAYAYKNSTKDWRLKTDVCSDQKYQACFDRMQIF